MSFFWGGIVFFEIFSLLYIVIFTLWLTDFEALNMCFLFFAF